jgi:hypothetical protein
LLDLNWEPAGQKVVTQPPGLAGPAQPAAVPKVRLAVVKALAHMGHKAGIK